MSSPGWATEPQSMPCPSTPHCHLPFQALHEKVDSPMDISAKGESGTSTPSTAAPNSCGIKQGSCKSATPH